MGPVYLRRLAVLHDNRKEALRGLLLIAPNMHEDTSTCKVDDRRAVMRAYGLSAAYLAWEGTASADSEWIMSGMTPLFGRVSCEICKENLRKRLTLVLEEWDKVKSTI